jgi:predicted PurR-regulated permease PerM
LERGAAWSWRFLVVAAAVYVVFWVVARIQVVVVAVFMAIVVASALEPAVTWLERRRLPRLAGTWLCALVAAAVVAGSLALVVPRFVAELDDLGSRLGQAADEGKDWLVNGPPGLSRQQADDFGSEVEARIASGLNGLIPDPVAGLGLVAQAVTGILVAAVLTFYFVKDGSRMWQWFLAHIRPGRRPKIDLAGRRSLAAVRGWLRAVAVTGLIDAVGIGVALAVIGVPLAYALAVLTFFAAFLPLVGALAAGTLAVLVAFVANGVTDAVIVAAVVLAVQQIEGDILMPLVMSRSISMHPVVVLVALTAGGAYAGVIGAVVAVPLTAAIVAVWSTFAEPFEGTDRPAVESQAARSRAGPASSRDRA